MDRLADIKGVFLWCLNCDSWYLFPKLRGTVSLLLRRVNEREKN